MQWKEYCFFNVIYVNKLFIFFIHLLEFKVACFIVKTFLKEKTRTKVICDIRLTDQQIPDQKLEFMDLFTTMLSKFIPFITISFFVPSVPLSFLFRPPKYHPPLPCYHIQQTFPSPAPPFPIAITQWISNAYLAKIMSFWNSSGHRLQNQDKRLGTMSSSGMNLGFLRVEGF